MSGEIAQPAPPPPRRRYTKRRRAEREDETRRRITEATMELHETVGPARTTVSGIAALAGVQRATVYRHFPDEGALIAACSGEWTARNPLPDLGAWAAIDDPDARLRAGLDELYGWFDRTEPMVEQIGRDVAVVEALRDPVARFGEWFGAAAGVLAAGRPEAGGRTAAALAHAVAFDTWRSLVRRQGLSRDGAVELMARLAACAAGPG